MKPGPKPGSGTKIQTTVSIDRVLKAEIETRTENLSGYLNEAGWSYLPKWDKRKTKGEKP